jgi:hypothetical protein
MHPRPCQLLLLCVSVLPVFASCNQGPAGPKLVHAAGLITLDGKPLGSADVMFIPQGETKGNGGVGRTDPAGNFDIRSHDRKDIGLPVGDYKVIVSKLVKPDGTDYTPDPNAGPIYTGGFKELLPAAYTEQDRSQLTATIPPEGTTTLEFKLNSKAR